MRRRDRRGRPRGPRRPPGRHRGRRARSGGRPGSRPPTGCSTASRRSPSAASSTAWCWSTSAATPVRDALLWNDTRSAPQAADASWTELGGPQAWADATGLVPVASFTVTKLRWVAEHEPEVAGRTAACCSPTTGSPDQLRGGAGEPTTDRGDASGTGYWSAADRRLPPRPAARRVRPRPAPSPRRRPRRGRRPDARRVALAPAPATTWAPRWASSSSPATWSSHWAPAAPSSRSRPADRRPHRHRRGLRRRHRRLPAPGVHAERRPGDRRRAADGRRRPRRPRPARAVGRPTPPGWCCCRSSTASARPALPDATGLLHGLTRANATPAHLVRAAVEGMLCGLADAVAPLAASGVIPRRIVLIGGAARSAAVQQIAAGCSALPVVVPEPAEYVALGAARQAAWTLSQAEPRPAGHATRPRCSPRTARPTTTAGCGVVRRGARGCAAAAAGLVRSGLPPAARSGETRGSDTQEERHAYQTQPLPQLPGQRPAGDGVLPDRLRRGADAEHVRRDARERGPLGAGQDHALDAGQARTAWC